MVIYCGNTCHRSINYTGVAMKELFTLTGVDLENPISKQLIFKPKIIEYDWRAKNKRMAQHIRERLLGNSTVNKNKSSNKRVTSNKKKKRRKR